MHHCTWHTNKLCYMYGKSINDTTAHSWNTKLVGRTDCPVFAELLTQWCIKHNDQNRDTCRLLEILWVTEKSKERLYSCK